MSAPMLSVENLGASYGAAQILYDLSLNVGRGEVVALMGRNGAGKTTTMKAIMGLMAQSTGKIRFDAKRQIKQDVSGAVPRVQPVDLEHGLAHRTALA